MSKKKPEIVKVSDQKLGFNEKLKGVKFEQAFDNTAIDKAEKIIQRSKDKFRKATQDDFEELKKTFDQIAADIERSQKTLAALQDYAFSIKSRADTGGFKLASDVSRSLFEFCEKYVKVMDGTKFSTLKLHVAALEEIFTGKFNSEDEQKRKQLLSGLQKLVMKSADKK